MIFGLQGSAQLWTVFDYVDTFYAEKLLPEYLQLAPSSAFPPGRHPMMYSFGTQTVAMRPFVRFKMTYDESIIGVCHVELRKEVKNGTRRGPYSVMTATTVSRLLPMVLGRAIGFPKSLKLISNGELSYRVKTILQRQLMLANDVTACAGSSCAPEHPALPIIETFLAHPVISRTPWGTLLASKFHIEKRTWKVVPAEVLGRVKAQDLAGLPGGTYRWLPIDDKALGAFLAEHNWIGDWPSRVSRQAMER